MKLETDKIPVPLWVLFILGLSVLTVGFVIWYYFIDDNNAKLSGLVGGISSGLAVAIFTFAISIRPLQTLDKFERMGIRELLTNRHDKIYYQCIVGNAQKDVCVMGASCTRFVEDFLDMDSDDKVLVDALSKHRNLRVQLLIPEEQYMSPEAKIRSGIVKGKITALKAEFKGRVELRHFPERAQHSFVISDNDLIAGPIFESDKSKHAPAVHVAMSTPFGQKYREHFDHVWDTSARRE